MNDKKTHYKILWISLSVCLVIYLDILLIPSKYHDEVVTSLYKSVSKSRRYGGTWYWMETENGKYGICPTLYNGLTVGQSVTVTKSLVTNANRRLEIRSTIYGCDVGFIKDSGLVYLTFISIITVVFMCFYEKVLYVPGRRHLTIYLAISSLVLFSLHLIK